MEYAKKIKVINELGFHLRAAAVFAKEAERFKSDIKVRNVTTNGPAAEGKSVMGLVTLIALKGSEVEIKASGPDAKEAVAKLAKMVQSKFGEKQ